MTRILILTLAIFLGLLVRPVAADRLKVLIVGAQNARGQFIAALFDSEENWLREPREVHHALISRSGTALAVFDLPPGRYGLAIYHDANSDGEINRGFLGMPVEAYGFSNVAEALLEPPGFVAAGFDLPAGGGMISIRLDRIEEARG